MIENFKEGNQRKIALLIDGDNVQPHLIGKIIAETGRHGLVPIRRIYGDWTTPNMNGWKKNLNNFAIQPIQQFRFTTGKNATDSALIIDAMDILHGGYVNGFCIVSSDSDYTRLATRIRENGNFVMGIGEKKTPEAFQKACQIFVHTENFTSVESNRKEKNYLNKSGETHNEFDPIPLIKDAYEMAASDGEWVHLGAVGLNLRQLDPSFDPRTYGYKQLSQLVSAYPDLLELKVQQNEPDSPVFYLKVKE